MMRIDCLSESYGIYIYKADNKIGREADGK